jgi:WD40 repeat protein
MKIIGAALLLVILETSVALAQLYEQPFLIIDPGVHTALIRATAVDAAGRVAATSSDDKTVRVWSVSNGKLLQTIRIPAGPGDIGKIYGLAISPDGNVVAAGGRTGSTSDAPAESIYFFDTRSGKMTTRITGLPSVPLRLAFSPDGRYLAVSLLGGHGLRVYDRARQWTETFRDIDYGESAAIYGLAFASNDSRLATTSYDGKVRLYDREFKLAVPPKKVGGGDQPFRIAFSPDGAKLAIGFEDAPKVELLDGHSLASLPEPNLHGLTNGNLSQVAFSMDGKLLYAGGAYDDGRGRPVVVWSGAGFGERRALPAGVSSISGLAALPNGELLVTAADPFFELLDADGNPRWRHPSPNADFRDQQDTLAISVDGAIVDFGFQRLGNSPLRFDLAAVKLSRAPLADRLTVLADRTALKVEGWRDGFSPTLDSKPISLQRYERPRSMAVYPDGTRFALGTNWSLRAFDAKGQSLWRRAAPGTVWAVNVSGDGRLVIGAYADGTIRWHRADDGHELLALFVLADMENWVAWTPEGFYGATPGAFGVLQWHVNRGFDAAADTVPVSAIPRSRRHSALALVLQEQETARALGLAELKAARRDVQIATAAVKPPGARLHVLTIGISDYGSQARDLRLKFAHRDAQDLVDALVKTQEGSLYAEVKPMFLLDELANRSGIFDALSVMERNMAGSTGQDLAVVIISGHGAIIDGEIYLVPHGADASTRARLKSSAILSTDLRAEIIKLAAHGRVLVLLDACRSASLLGGALPGADMLRSAFAAGNVTVLTSSTGNSLSREEERWQHSAFAKVLLDALSVFSGEVDTNRDGMISVAELSAYVASRLPRLTGGDQQLGIDQRFRGDIFFAGL